MVNINFWDLKFGTKFVLRLRRFMSKCGWCYVCGVIMDSRNWRICRDDESPKLQFSSRGWENLGATSWGI